MANTNLTAERLRELTIYDAETGVFSWRIRRSGVSFHKPIGCFDKSTGYKKMCVDGVASFLHRFAWLYVAGEFPNGQIDHINRNRSDNRICNLRVVNQSENQQNKSKLKNNTSGFKGVTRDKKMWEARIVVNNIAYHLGNFKTPELAGEAYKKAAEIMHPFSMPSHRRVSS